MCNCRTTPKPVITGLKLSKDDDGSTVDPTLFKRLVGSLMYLTVTRPDIMYGLSLISRFMESPKDSHWKAGKRILRYGGNIDDRKRTFGYTFHFGRGVVSWASKKHPIVTQYSMESNYVAATSAAC